MPQLFQVPLNNYIEEAETSCFEEVGNSSLGLRKLALSVWDTLHFHPNERDRSCRVLLRSHNIRHKAFSPR
jgi:hypothetical protein